jgi:hypothetical protein
MSTYTNHGKTTSAKRNSGRKSTLTERGRRTLQSIFFSKNYRTTAAQVTGQQNWIFILKILFTSNLSHVSFTNPRQSCNCKPLITENKAHMRKRWCTFMTIKPGHQQLKTRVIWSDNSSFTLFPTSGNICVWITPKEAYNTECLVPTVKHGEVLRRCGQQCQETVFCWSHYYPSWPKFCKGVRGQVVWSGASHDLDVISEQWCSFPRRRCPHSHNGNCSVMGWRTWRWTSTSSLASTIASFEHQWTILVSFGD